MKTPREILFESHREVEPKLDAIRHKTIAELRTATDRGTTGASRRKTPLIGAILRSVWIELVCPYRRAWAAIAVLWLAVATANLSMKTPFSSAPVTPSAPAPNVIQALNEQRRLLAELLPPVSATPAVKGTQPKGQPRSERRVLVKAC
jgi:hypothetical protein